jgi:hypothetical protein
MRLLIEWNGTVDWTRKFWKDGAGKIYCINWQRPLLHIIDEIGRVLAKHCGFTDEELDFIINYDIKYHMGIN